MDDPPVAIHKNYINRESHGHSVYRLRWGNKKSRTGFKITFAQQSYEATETRSGDPNLFAEHRIPGGI